MKIGDKVKHVNTGEHIYTILKIKDGIATIKRPKELWVQLNTKSKSSPIIDISICNIKNLTVVNCVGFKDCLNAIDGEFQVHEITLSGKCLKCNKQVIKI